MRDEKDQPACVQLILSRRRFLQGMTVSAALAPFLSACEFAELKDVEVVDGVEFDLSQPDFSALETVGGLAVVNAGSIDLLLVRAVELLLRHGAAVDLPNVMGVTPLMTVAGISNSRLSRRSRNLGKRQHGRLSGADRGSRLTSLRRRLGSRRQRWR